MSPNNLIIFGFTGDLSRRKLLPALYNLERTGNLGDEFMIIGITRREINMDELADQLEEFITAEKDKCDREVLNKLFSRVSLASGDIGNGDDYPNIRNQINGMLPQDCEEKLFYFAIPPNLFEDVIDNIVKVDLHKCGEHVSSRLLIEKPFGHSLESAQRLISKISDNFGPKSIYPIDHYLAKDAAQNILYFRFHNPLLQGLWEGHKIKCIQISALEFLDIQGRIAFYEKIGALRDMLQGHLLQVLALVTMDEPASLDDVDVRHQKQILLRSIKPIRPEDVKSVSARGQYIGYKEAVENVGSSTETFAALKLEIDNRRWRGVPILLRAGKAMENKLTEINIIFESSNQNEHENILTFRLQPSEGIAITLTAKKHGLTDETSPITLDHCYDETNEDGVDAYDHIIYDAIRGNQALFPTNEEILASWALVQPVLDAWEKDGSGLVEYAKGSRSVDSADELIKRFGGEWIHNESWVCNPHFDPPPKT